MTTTPRRTAAAFALVAAGCTIALIPCDPTLARPYLRVPADAARPDDLPDTPAGRVARAFLIMLNDGSEKSVAAFESAYASSSRRASVDAAERAKRIAPMREQWGTFTLDRVLDPSDASLTLGVRVASGDTIQLEFQMSSAEPGKLDAVIITSGGPAEKPAPVTRQQVEHLIDDAARALEESYVFPDVAKKMVENVRSRFAAGGYDDVKDERQLAERLTDDLRAVSKDKHLRVRFSPREESEGEHLIGPDPEEVRKENYGFRKVELLPGNIGYLRFDFFLEEPQAKQVASAAIQFLHNADAVIFDLRSNGGGSPDMIRYITSYLFDKPTHLNDMIDREGKTVEEFWTLQDIPGQRFPNDFPIYVLTSARTFSGAEEFSYNLKNLKRATIIGETTGGGAHPVMGKRLDDRFVIGVPYMRACNPISKTNWEGTGVEPDIKTTAGEALDRAIAEARKAIEKRRAAADADK